MDENTEIKEELLSLYNEIKNNITEKKIQTNTIKNKEDINACDSLSIISTIKDMIQLLISIKPSEINSNTFGDESGNENSKMLKDYIQLENLIIKLENDNKYYLKKFMQYKIQKDSLEAKLNAYMALEEEYEELKEKVKYEGGKFLDNDRKDNEIIILRSENSALKKEIINFEMKNKNNEYKTKEYQNKIKDLQNNVENLNKKIYKLEKIIKDNTVKNNSNSCNNLRIKSNENLSNKNNYTSEYSLANLKNIINLNNTNNNRRLPNFHSPKNDLIYLEHNKNLNNNTINAINTNIFAGSYNKVINGINNKKIKIPIKKDFNLLKQPRNNSISVIRGRETDESKTLIKGKHLHKSGSKTKTNNNKIFNLNSKTNNIYPLSCKNSKNGQIVRRYIQKEFNRNSSSQNIKEMH